MSLSVMSAFTRLNIDPWREAARLSNLSKEKAVEALAPIIARLPVGRWAAVDVPAIARRLVDFLPQHDFVIQSVIATHVRSRARSRVIYAVLMILVTLAYFGFVAHRAPPPADETAPSAKSDAPR